MMDRIRQRLDQDLRTATSRLRQLGSGGSAIEERCDAMERLDDGSYGVDDPVAVS